MTDQEKQEYLDAVRVFLERNDGRPLLLVGAALVGDDTLDGCRLPYGIRDVGDAVNVYGGIFLAAIGTSGSQETKIKLLAASTGQALKLLGNEAEAGKEASGE